MEVFEAVLPGRFVLGFRNEARRFDRRLDPDATTAQRRALLTAEVGNVLNLSWYAVSDASLDGEIMVLISAPFEKR